MVGATDYRRLDLKISSIDHYSCGYMQLKTYNLYGLGLGQPSA